MPRTIINFPLPLAILFVLSFAPPVNALESALDIKDIYFKSVDRQLILPAEEQRYYAELVLDKLQQGGLNNLSAQYLLMVDRSPLVQAALLFWQSEDAQIELIGASPVSTCKENGYEYFETPVGIFEHTTGNLDFRAEGTKNERGLMGYGDKGMRVYDFGWVTARKTWTPEMGKMRLQLHSTDQLRLEPMLGIALSMGCIRIPATLNRLLDHYGVLDSNYERARSNKKILAALYSTREPNPWAGKYLIIVDSRRINRPDWSPLPVIPKLPAKIPKPSYNINH